MDPNAFPPHGRARSAAVVGTLVLVVAVGSASALASRDSSVLVPSARPAAGRPGPGGTAIGVDRGAPVGVASTAEVTSVVRALVDRVDGERALDDVRRLSGELPLCVDGACDVLPNRVTGGPDVARAVDWLAAEARDLGYDVTVEDWTYRTLRDRNVLAVKAGVVTPTEKVYFVAHVDGVASCPLNVCPGADDNASGTVGGLEILRAFADAAFARTLVVFFSTGEEQGTLGVNAFLARASAADLASINSLVNSDMIGYDSDGDRVLELYYGDHAPSLDLALAMQRWIRAYEPALVPRVDKGCG